MAITWINLLILSLSYLYLTRCQDNSPNVTCKLSGRVDENPFPSLTKCYKYNSDSCCTSVHDDYISNYVKNLLTDSCIRKYPELEDLFCFGCNPKEPIFANYTTKQITLCLSYALSLWNATVPEELNKKSYKYDNCGFKVPDYLKDDTTSGYIIPSQKFDNLTHMISQLRIPFFENYTIRIINSTDDCFSTARFLTANYFVLMILLLSYLRLF